MNIQMEIYKNSLKLSDQQLVSIIKKARYILSKTDLHKDTITFNLGNMISDKNNNENVLAELKKLINMSIYLVQSDKLDNINFYMDTLFDENSFKNMIFSAKLSGITNKIHIKAKNIKENSFAIDFPELNIEKYEKPDIIFEKRFILDRKQEFIYWEDTKGEK